jgi:hypothetical protein
VVRCFWHLIHLSDISKCDGISLDEFVILDSTELSTEYRFPWEEPTSLNFCLWKDAIHRLCSGTLMLPCRLGRFLHSPHLPCRWYMDEDATMLFRICDAAAVPSYDTYRRRTGLGTWHGVKYDWASLECGTYPGTHFASVTMCEATVAVVHSTAPFPVSHPTWQIVCKREWYPVGKYVS